MAKTKEEVLDQYINFMEKAKDFWATPYKILGVSEDATKKDIDAAHREKAKKLHPDKGGDDEDFKLMKKAYELLQPDIREYTDGFIKLYRDLAAKRPAPSSSSDARLSSHTTSASHTTSQQAESSSSQPPLIPEKISDSVSLLKRIRMAEIFFQNTPNIPFRKYFDTGRTITQKENQMPDPLFEEFEVRLHIVILYMLKTQGCSYSGEMKNFRNHFVDYAEKNRIHNTGSGQDFMKRVLNSLSSLYVSLSGRDDVDKAYGTIFLIGMVASLYGTSVTDKKYSSVTEKNVRNVLDEVREWWGLPPLLKASSFAGGVFFRPLPPSSPSPRTSGPSPRSSR